MIKINIYVNKLMKFPLPNRREFELIIKEIYHKGREDEKKKNNYENTRQKSKKKD